MDGHRQKEGSRGQGSRGQVSTFDIIQYTSCVRIHPSGYRLTGNAEEENREKHISHGLTRMDTDGLGAAFGWKDFLIGHGLTLINTDKGVYLQPSAERIRCVCYAAKRTSPLRAKSVTNKSPLSNYSWVIATASIGAKIS